MADELEGVIALSVAGPDGLKVIEHNPGGVDTDSFSARFAMVMNMVEKSITVFSCRGLKALPDKLIHHLVRAQVDLHNLRVPHVFFHGILFGIPVGAHHLHAVRCDL